MVKDSTVFAVAGLGALALYMFRKDASKVTGGVGDAVQGVGTGINEASVGLGEGVGQIGITINDLLENVSDFFDASTKGWLTLGQQKNLNVNEATPEAIKLSNELNDIKLSNLTNQDLTNILTEKGVDMSFLKSIKSPSVAMPTQKNLNPIGLTVPNADLSGPVAYEQKSIKSGDSYTIKSDTKVNSLLPTKSSSSSSSSSKSLKSGETYKGVTNTSGKKTTVLTGDFGTSASGNKITKKIIIG